MTRKLCFGERCIKAELVIKGILFFSLLFLPVRGYGLEVGDKALQFQSVTLEGKEISCDRDFKGKKPVYLIFWTTWCPHCKKELPLVEKLYKEFGGGVEFIGVNLGIKEAIDKFVKNNHVSFPIVYDDGNRIAEAFGAQIQTNILIDKGGVITYKERGFQEDMDKYLRKLAE
jgi:peroxiredoxin